MPPEPRSRDGTGSLSRWSHRGRGPRWLCRGGQNHIGIDRIAGRPAVVPGLRVFAHSSAARCMITVVIGSYYKCPEGDSTATLGLRQAEQLTANFVACYLSDDDITRATSNAPTQSSNILDPRGFTARPSGPASRMTTPQSSSGKRTRNRLDIVQCLVDPFRSAGSIARLPSAIGPSTLRSERLLGRAGPFGLIPRRWQQPLRRFLGSPRYFQLLVSPSHPHCTDNGGR